MQDGVSSVDGSKASDLPRSFLACLPFLWQQVLFPGIDPKPERPRWSAAAFFLFLSGFLLYPCLSFLLFEPDEGRYAEIPREMLAGGDWTVPHLQGQPYLDKPPLFYWLVAGSYQLLGVHDWSARLVPALAIQASVLLTYLIGCRLLGEKAGFWGGLTLALAPGFMTMGRLLVLDGVLAFFVLLSLWTAFEAVRGDRLRPGSWLLCAVSCGLGVLTKGPIALVLAIVPVVLFQWLGRSRCPIGWRGWLSFTAAVLAIDLPWHAAVVGRAPEFACYFFWKHNIIRFLVAFDHQQPIWFYTPIVLAGLLPASLMIVPFTRFLFSGRDQAAHQRCPAVGFLLASGVWCVFFFTLSGSKLPTYVLPAFPLLALAIGYSLSLQTWRRRWPIKVAAMTAAGLLAGVHFIAIPRYALFHSPMQDAATVRAYCADPKVPVICYPRSCDSVAFYLERADFRSYRSKETADLLAYLETQKRTVLLFTHRHSPDFLRTVLPPHLELTELTPISCSWNRTRKTEYCYMGICRQAREPHVMAAARASAGD
jgi:4-amino-4-deoxy-L-arabinose transferase-like glycosyltransferase